jgi:hypothetical protein
MCHKLAPQRAPGACSVSAGFGDSRGLAVCWRLTASLAAARCLSLVARSYAGHISILSLTHTAHTPDCSDRPPAPGKQNHRFPPSLWPQALDSKVRLDRGIKVSVLTCRVARGGVVTTFFVPGGFPSTPTGKTAADPHQTPPRCPRSDAELQARCPECQRAAGTQCRAAPAGARRRASRPAPAARDRRVQGIGRRRRPGPRVQVPRQGREAGELLAAIGGQGARWLAGGGGLRTGTARCVRHSPSILHAGACIITENP